jgi:sugar lactone lactonase YvrE
MKPRGYRTGAAVGTVIVMLLGALTVQTASMRDAAGQALVLRGRVMNGGTPLAGYEVGVVATDERPVDTDLGIGVTDGTGSFEIALTRSPLPNEVTYVAAGEGPGPVSLVSVLGTGSMPAEVVVNERTTVAAAYGMAQFVGGPARLIVGSGVGIRNATGMVHNLVDPVTGELGEVVATPPNGSETSTITTFNSLANMVAACVATPVVCAALMSAATPPGGPAPLHTFDAMAGIARNPAGAVLDLFAISLLPPAPYAPARDVPPPAWTVALRFDGDGSSVDGPGNFAIDHEGNLWVTENYEFNANPLIPVCGSEVLSKFKPNGEYAPGSPIRGGGLSGAGFGIDIDRYGDVWVGNYGFAAPVPDCPAESQPPHNSVSKFSPDGTALSPPTGFTQGGVSWPQGTIFDRDGNLWIANCHTDTLTQYPGGDPGQAKELGGLGLDQPFDIIDNGEHLFVTGAASSTVAMLRRDGTPTAASPIAGGGLQNPLGITADRSGNVWAVNTGLVTLPCPDRPAADTNLGSLTLIRPDGTPGPGSPFTGGGITVAWGVAVDGVGNVWVANFAGKRLSHYCGADPAQCPPGMSTGDAISPDGLGYGFDGLVRNTGVDVDQSGNVWLANNWLEVPVQSNPGGHQIVAYVGLAPPVERAAPVPKPVPVPPPAVPVVSVPADPLPATGDSQPWRLALALALLGAAIAVRSGLRPRGTRHDP